MKPRQARKIVKQFALRRPYRFSTVDRAFKRVGERKAEGWLHSELQREIAADLRSPRTHGKKRPPWLKPWVELECGFKVMDAWIEGNKICVVCFGELKTVSVDVTFRR